MSDVCLAYSGCMSPTAIHVMRAMYVCMFVGMREYACVLFGLFGHMFVWEV